VDDDDDAAAVARDTTRLPAANMMEDDAFVR
jgi:hypothetical protein